MSPSLPTVRAPGRAIVWLASLALALAPPAAAPVAAQSQGASESEPTGERPIHRIPRATSEITVDGRLEEPAWSEAVTIELPWEYSPGDNLPAPVRTECRLTYDDDRLYWACRAFDPEPSRIRAHLADRDTPFDDDHVVLLLDTFDDQRRAYQFRVNPRGVQMDALFGQGSEDLSWDAIWNSAGRITGDGYVVEAAIPFESLSFQRRPGAQRWGIIVERSWPRGSRHRLRSIRTDRADPCLLCQAETLAGIQGVQPGTPVELNPTLTAGRTDERTSLKAARLETGEVDVEPGLNARWRITPNVSLDATVNPDFSQVEADAAQLEANRRFALFFSEKRPFFLEGADLFAVPANLIFTRSVIDPIVGAKITGKEGGNAFGAFLTHDEVNGLIFPGPRGSSRTLLEDEVTAGVARYRRDVGESSTLGGFVTARGADGYHNVLAGVDGQIRLSRSARFVGLLAHTDTEYPDAVAEAFGQPGGSFTGQGYALAFSYSGREWDGAVEWNAVDPTVRADAGFLPQTGFRGPQAGVGYTFWGDADRWFNRIRLSAFGARREDYQGALLRENVEVGGFYQGPLQSVIDYDVAVSREGFGGEEFSLVNHDVRAEFRPSGAVELGTYVEWGDAIDFANVRKADILVIEPEIELRLGAHLETELEHRVERLSTSGREIFLAHLSEGRAVWHFSRRAFVRAILQYRHLRRDPALYDEPVEAVTEGLFTQMLFSYKVNPRTVFFAGYSDNRLGLTEVDLTQTDRSFFLKLGYAWRP